MRPLKAIAFRSRRVLRRLPIPRTALASARAIAVASILRRPDLAHDIVRRAGSPSLFELFDTAESWHTEPASMLADVFSLEIPEAVDLIVQGRAAVTEVGARRAVGAYPPTHAIEAGTALLLYATVRLQQPAMFLETGVGDGLSTAIILKAMEENGLGELHSIDIADDVGTLVTDRSRWHLHIVPPNQPEAAVGLIESLAPLDVFFHDGDHSYMQQLAEYTAAWTALRVGGLLMSDDVDWSYAFLDFADICSLQASFLLDTRKVVAAVRRGDGWRDGEHTERAKQRVPAPPGA